MATVRAEEVRIPRRAREALARHENVVVLNHDRPTFVIVNSEDHLSTTPTVRRGRILSEALKLLANVALPDARFGDDLETYLTTVGPTPTDPWEPS